MTPFNRGRLRRALTSCLFVGVALSSAAGADTFVPAGLQVGAFLDGVQNHKATMADFDLDGRPELVAVTGHNRLSSTAVLLQGYDAGGAWVDKQMLPLRASVLKILRPVVWNTDGEPHLLLVDSAGEARVYRGWPLVWSRTISVAGGASASVVADVDADGEQDLLIGNAHELHAYRLSDGSLLWSAGVGATDMLALQLDSDPALEVVLAGTPGRVLDGATREIEFTDDEGYGAPLWSLAGSGRADLKFAAAPSGGGAAAYGGSALQRRWTADTRRVRSFASADLDGDRVAELLATVDGERFVHVIDLATGADRPRVDNLGSQSTGLAAGDFDGDGAAEVVVSTESALDHRLFVYERDGRPKAKALSRLPFTVGARGDVDDDGRDELVFMSGEGRVQVADAQTRQLEWLSAAIPAGEPPFFVDAVAVMQADLDGALEIVQAGSRSQDAYIRVIDGKTREVEFNVDAVSVNAFKGRYVSAIRPAYLGHTSVHQHGPDEVQELVVVTQAFGSPGGGARVHVLTPIGADEIFSSAPLGALFERSKAVDVGQADADPTPEIAVGVIGGVHIFDSMTGETQTVIPADSVQQVRLRDGVLHAARNDLYLTRYDVRTGQPTGEFTDDRRIGQLELLDDGSVLLSGAGTLRQVRYGQPGHVARATVGHLLPSNELLPFTMTKSASGVEIEAFAAGSLFRLHLLPTLKSSTWWVAQESGWGLFVFDQGNAQAVAWFSYDTDGRPFWLLAAVRPQPDGSMQGGLYRSTGVPFNATEGTVGESAERVGEVRLRYQDAQTLKFDYVYRGQAQSKTLRRFTYGADSLACVPSATSSRATAKNYSDVWWGGSNNSGWGLFVTHLHTRLYALWYTYDAQRQPRFYTAVTTRQANGSYAGRLYEQAPGTPLLQITGQPASPSAADVGGVSFVFTDGQNALFHYALAGRSESRPITRFQFGDTATRCAPAILFEPDT